MAVAPASRLKPWLERVDALELRERLLLLCAGIVVLFLLIDTLWLQPVLQAQQVTAERLSTLDARLNGLRQNASLLTIAPRDPLQPLRSQRDRLQHELALLDAGILGQLGALVEPAQAARVLEQLIDNYAGLTLTALNASSEPLDGAQANAGGRETGLSRYQIDMLISGGYLEVLRYLKKLETLPWKFFWQQVNFQSTGYPSGETRLRLYTLGAAND